MASRRFVFTLNNYTPEEVTALDVLAATPSVRYLVYGYEVGDSGTNHLQGFIIFTATTTFRIAKARLGERAHLEVARGSSKQASDYCKKDGNYKEHGDFPGCQGRRNDWDVYKDWIVDIGRVPSRTEICLKFPALYARYKRACVDYAEALAPPPVLTDSEPRFGWQTRVAGIIEGEPTDRTVNFVVDPEGNSGKSWICKWAITKHPERVQIFRIGKRDDLAYCIDIDKDIFLFDIPRGQMTYLQYSVLESMKDRMIFSPKYESSFKILRKIPTVIVFSNEEPEQSSMSRDRFNIIRI